MTEHLCEVIVIAAEAMRSRSERIGSRCRSDRREEGQ
jgi:hypothetical protein